MAFHTPDHESPSDSNTPKRLYNPYKDLEVPIGNLYQLPIYPEHLFIEEAQKKHRSWGESLTFYTGCGYLAGAVAGAGVGLVEGVKSFEKGDTTKLRVNRILNSSGHAGRTWGNRIGVISLLYSGIESGITAARDTDDVLSSVAAGLGTGALYRAARGVRSAAVAGAVGGVVVGVAVTAKQVLKRYVPNIAL
ncbi:mitochondrial import inner membrane translocase subunit TIM23-2-like protein [Trifolium pratense]|uniref:Mitochondrial import inner membrane translocase subunit TIM23-2-like protein n=1 Tax=Trifolium pratense TaxID=57577 RepID=A0A2K3N0C9_TRIPR|nr:mitochondrial import inner membrane translocase subunit TIM23-2-like protein [Trifolium pratense]PNX96500.1 mitochondrial import inner membrane translocase subunit TIM23-2-like protein [Trifolium pratense]